jgi:uncharacterized protein (DUF1501 family)
MFDGPSSLSTRRLFLQKGLALLAAAPTVPSFIDRTVMAMSDPLDASLTQQTSGKDGKILVVVQMSGGNDGLNTVIPYADDHYHSARPTLGHDASKVIRLTDYIGLHPNLTGFKELFDDARLAIIQGVGYPNPNRSHFRSMDIWQSADPEHEVVTSGWIGRYFDNTCVGADPRIGISLGDQQPVAMHGEHVRTLSFERPEAYRYNGRDAQRYLKLNQLVAGPATAPAVSVAPVENHSYVASRAIAKAAPAVTAASQLDFLSRTAMDAQASSDQILRIVQNHREAGTYPAGEFGNGLRTIAAMIGGGLPTRVYYIALSGFDTHANERARHDQLMTQLSGGIKAFWADMKAQNNGDRVLMMTFSEFGRRVAQNASGGTDHGTAAPMFLIGPKLNPGINGQHPSLADLDQGDLKYKIDFRSVYATVLQSWLNTPSKPILGQQFPMMNVLRG